MHVYDEESGPTRDDHVGGKITNNRSNVKTTHTIRATESQRQNITGTRHQYACIRSALYQAILHEGVHPS